MLTHKFSPILIGACIGLIVCLFVLLIPITPAGAASPPVPTPVGNPTPTPGKVPPQLNPKAPSAQTGCLTSIGNGRDIQGNIAGVSHNVSFAGVIFITLGSQSGIPSFCIDLLHNISIGDCFTSGAATDPSINWLLTSGYGPDNSLSNEENAARQAAIWHFSDNYTVTGPTFVLTRTAEIIAAVPANPTPNLAVPQLTISPPSVNLGNGKSYTFIVTATQGATPMIGQVVTLTTDFGTLSVNQVTTQAPDGTATFTISNTVNNPGTAHVSASFGYQLPIGTSFTGVVADKQKLVLAIPTDGLVVANALATWANTPTAVKVSSFTASSMNDAWVANPFLFPGLAALIVLGALAWLTAQRLIAH